MLQSDRALLDRQRDQSQKRGSDCKNDLWKLNWTSNTHRIRAIAARPELGIYALLEIGSKAVQTFVEKGLDPLAQMVNRKGLLLATNE